MSISDFSQNLQLLCSYGRSVSAIGRAAGINRHQMQRYLNGSSTPSFSTLRRLSDFFGLEDHEILLPHDDFSALIRIRPPRLERSRDRVADFTTQVSRAVDLRLAQHYVGYYFIYFQPDRRQQLIHRAITRVTLEDRCLVTKTIERYPGGVAGLPRMVKYEGVAFINGKILTVMERRRNIQESMFFSMLYCTDNETPVIINGLSLGIEPNSTRALFSLRICWQYLGQRIDIRSRLSQCGQLPFNDPSVGDYVRFSTDNSVLDGDATFGPRT